MLKNISYDVLGLILNYMVNPLKIALVNKQYHHFVYNHPYAKIYNKVFIVNKTTRGQYPNATKIKLRKSFPQMVVLNFFPNLFYLDCS